MPVGALLTEENARNAAKNINRSSRGESDEESDPDPPPGRGKLKFPLQRMSTTPRHFSSSHSYAFHSPTLTND